MWRMRGKELCVHEDDAKRFLTSSPNTPRDTNMCNKNGTPTKRQVSKRLVSKRPVSKRLKRQVYKTSGLQNGSSLKKVYIYSVLVVDWKSASSVASMFAGKVIAVFYSLF
jgi:hypothetical protein